jgi:hypothetical protein
MHETGQFFLQRPHRTQTASSMRCGVFTAPAIAPTGQAFAHRVQPIQRDSSTE